jgi:hypothetical protein
MSSREADELMSAGRVSPDRAALRHLLDQLAAPPRPDERAGRQAAVAAFTRAVRDPVPPPEATRRRSMSWLVLSRAALVKVVIGVGVLLCGSAALAAGTGHLPGGVQHGAHDLFAPLGVPVPDVPGRGAGGSGRGGAAGPLTGPASPTRGDPAPASPAAVSLCRAWAAAMKDSHGNDLDSTLVQALARAAGGTDKIPAFCLRVLSGAAASPPASLDPAAGLPEPPGLPTAKPTHSPKDKGKPKPSPTSQD